MSIVAERNIVDFAEAGVDAAENHVLIRGLDELIARLSEEGLLHELLAHPWISQPEVRS
jgi:hypothetical protein